MHQVEKQKWKKRSCDTAVAALVTGPFYRGFRLGFRIVTPQVSSPWGYSSVALMYIMLYCLDSGAVVRGHSPRCQDGRRRKQGSCPRWWPCSGRDPGGSGPSRSYPGGRRRTPGTDGSGKRPTCPGGQRLDLHTETNIHPFFNALPLIFSHSKCGTMAQIFSFRAAASSVSPWLNLQWTGRTQTAPPSSSGTRRRGAASGHTPGAHSKFLTPGSVTACISKYNMFLQTATVWRAVTLSFSVKMLSVQITERCMMDVSRPVLHTSQSITGILASH